jgi:MarR family transcriptional regulator for hemolysin
MFVPSHPARRFFGARMAWTARAWRRVVDDVLAADGLSEATALPLTVLLRLGDGVRQGVLADQIGIEGPSLVRLLDQLQVAGLIERHDDPNDRRAKTIHLTAAGGERAERVETALQKARQVLLAEVSDGDLETTMHVLACIERAVHRLQES